MRLRIGFPFAAALCVGLAACGDGGGSSFSTKGLIAPDTSCNVDPRDAGEGDYLGSVDGPKTCGVENAWRMRSISGVALNNTATVNCGYIGPFSSWMGSTVQNAAERNFGERVVAVDVAASYSCRARNNRRGSKMSEHGYGNAVDIASFTLESGRKVSVKDGWRGEGDERRFLREVRSDACDEFKTVLGPGSDRAHKDHFHLDLQARRSGSHVCR
jgi:hypothetical protein